MVKRREGMMRIIAQYGDKRRQVAGGYVYKRTAEVISKQGYKRREGTMRVIACGDKRRQEKASRQ